MKVKKRFAVGIDAGKHTGFAVFDREEKRFVLYGTSNFWLVYELVTNFQKIEETVIVIEIPKQNFVFRQRAELKKQSTHQRLAFNVGMNYREAVLLSEGFKKSGFEVIEQIPQTAKWSKDDLRRFTGITERTSEHCRDAVKLVYGI